MKKEGVASSATISNLVQVQGETGPSRKITQQPEYLAPRARGEAHKELLKFINEMKTPVDQRTSAARDKASVIKLIKDTLAEVETTKTQRPGPTISSASVGTDLMRSRGSIAKMAIDDNAKFELQRASTKAAKHLLDTPKKGIEGLKQTYRQKSESLPGETSSKGLTGFIRVWKQKGDSKSDTTRNEVLQGLYAMIDTSQKWARPQFPDGASPAEHAAIQQLRDITVIARTANTMLSQKQQALVYARMLSVAHKFVEGLAVMKQVEKWLENNPAESMTVLTECIDQLMCGNVKLERRARKLITHYISNRSFENVKDLRDKFDAIKTKEWKWVPTDGGLRDDPDERRLIDDPNEGWLLDDPHADLRTHNKTIQKLDALFAAYFKRVDQQSP